MSRRSFVDYLAALGERESGQNYALESSLGFLGKYQLAESSLREIGYYEGDGTARNDYVGRWTGRDGVRSKAEFLASPAVQEKAVREYHDWNWQTLTRYGFDVYAGQTLNGQPLTLSGILGATWLVGFEGMRDFLQSGGTSAGRDPYGTSMLEYVELFNGYAAPYGTTLGGPNAISGGAGDDLLVGHGGNDTLEGGPGLDGARYANAFGQYTIARVSGGLTVSHPGAEGTDTLSGIEYLQFADGRVSVADALAGRPPSDGADLPAPSPRPMRLVGDRGDDRLEGGPRADTLVGARGDDALVGAGGGDRILGGPGNDRLDGGGGHDRLLGGTGDDHLSGGVGRDVLVGGAGDDTLLAGRSGDRLYGEAGNDHLAGSAHPDLLVGAGGDDTLIGAAANDRLFAGSGNDRVLGGAGADRLYGHRGNDRLDGGAGRDLLVGGAGDDTLNAGASGDRLYGGRGDDDLTGGAGADLLVGDRGDDRLRGGASDDRLLGGRGNDVLVGGPGGDRMRAGDGADVVYGGDGRDWLAGGRGNDILVGGEDADRFDFDQRGGRDTVVDFEPGVDRLDLLGTAATRIDHLIFREVGRDTLIYAGDVTIRLNGIDPDDLTPIDFII